MKISMMNKVGAHALKTIKRYRRFRY